MRSTSQGAVGTYLAALRAHTLLALFVLIATVAAAVAYLQVRTESYETTAEVLVTPLPVESQGAVALPLITEAPDATRVSQTAAALLRSNAAAEAVARRLPGDWDRERVLAAVQVQPRGESNVVAITAVAETPRLAADLANRYTDAALDARRQELETEVRRRLRGLQAQLRQTPGVGEREDLLSRITSLQVIGQAGDPTLSLSQAAPEPTVAASPGVPLVIAAAILAGIVLAFGAALLASAFDDRIRDEDEIFSLFPLPILAHVPDSTKRAADARAAESYRTLLAQLDSFEGSPQVVMVTSASSEEGKTTSALRLVYAARETGRSVIFLDFDTRKPMRAAPKGKGGASELVPVDLASAPRLTADGRLADALAQPDNDSGVAFVLPEVEEGGLGQAAFSRRLPELVREARELADLVIIDTAPLGEVGDALRLVDHVDSVLVVVRLGVTKRARFKAMRDLLQRRRRKTPDGVLLLGGRFDAGDSTYSRQLTTGARG